MSNWAIDGKSIEEILEIPGGDSLSVEARKELDEIINMRELGQEPKNLSPELQKFIGRACLGRVEIRSSGLRN